MTAQEKQDRIALTVYKFALSECERAHNVGMASSLDNAARMLIGADSMSKEDFLTLLSLMAKNSINIIDLKGKIEALESKLKEVE